MTWDEFKPKWVAALRSGEYQQARHALRDCTGFCCLGVAFDLITKEDDTRHWRPFNSVCHAIHGDVAAGAVIHQVVPEWLAEKLLQRDELGIAYQTHLVAKNDRKIPFNEIADYIEENL